MEDKRILYLKDLEEKIAQLAQITQAENCTKKFFGKEIKSQTSKPHKARKRKIMKSELDCF